MITKVNIINYGKRLKGNTKPEKHLLYKFNYTAYKSLRTYQGDFL